MRKRNPSITTRLHNINFQNRPNGQKPRSTLPRGKDGSITNSINTKIRRSRSEARTDQAIKFRLNTKCGQEQAQFASEAADKLIPVEQRKQLLDLENCHCRWGVGDPTKEEFFFCGAPDADLRASIPYCLEHAARSGVGFGKIDPSILRSQ
jgi:GcrA cell cycle regulator